MLVRVQSGVHPSKGQDDMNSELIEGHLEFYSETGTEGGYWAFYDTRFGHGGEPCEAKYCPMKFRELENEPGKYTLDGTGKRSSEFHADYEGLYTLKDGDWLDILDTDGTTVEWSGV